MSKNVKVYKMDECSWIATNLGFIETVAWYCDNVVTLTDEDIANIEECDINTECMWYPTENVDDLERIGDYDEVFHSKYVETRKHIADDLLRTSDGIYKYTPYVEVLKDYVNEDGDIAEPFEIASTEWR